MTEPKPVKPVNIDDLQLGTIPPEHINAVINNMRQRINEFAVHCAKQLNLALDQPIPIVHKAVYAEADGSGIKDTGWHLMLMCENVDGAMFVGCFKTELEVLLCMSVYQAIRAKVAHHIASNQSIASKELVH